ncbi:MAG: hypothetical protein II205_02045 [Bacteroidales bacterium]|nr:hypothetical protein [Bacteroidales bacterium]
MEPIIKEKETVYTEGFGGYGGGSNLRTKSDWALGLGIVGTVLGGAALAKQGGIGSILGGAAPAGPVTNYYGGGAGCPSVFSAYSKECEDVLALTNTFWAQKVDTLKSAAAAREVDVNEKFGLFINNRNSIDALRDKTNAEFFSLYKYTRDKDDETNARIANLESQVAVNSAIRPYQDKLIMCEIEKGNVWLKNYIDSKTCRMIEGVNVLPLTPEVTGVYSQNCCNRFPAPAAAPAAGA